MRHAAVAAIVCLAVASGACSFTLPVPPSEPSQRTRTAAKACLPSKGLYPLNDTLGATVGGINMVIARSARGDDVRYIGIEVDKSVAFWALGVAPLVAFGAGAIYGFIQCARCDTLLREHDLDFEGRRVEGAESVAPGDEREKRWSNPGDGSVGTVVQTREEAEREELPEWSAFRRVPLDGAGEKPKKAISPRTPVAPQP